MAFAEAPDGTHRYRATCTWSGSTGAGYDAYERAHRVEAPPAASALELSNDPSLGGDASRLDPEQLVLAAASSCQLLSFLAIAARARVDVTDYRDDAEADRRDRAAPADHRGAGPERPARGTARAPRPRRVLHRQQPRDPGGRGARDHVLRQLGSSSARRAR
jgi:organic hydroperoxide reductase OsmC/OhrA